MTCLRWILWYMMLEIWRKIGLSGDWYLCTALRTRGGACYYWTDTNDKAVCCAGNSRVRSGRSEAGNGLVRLVRRTHQIASVWSQRHRRGNTTTCFHRQRIYALTEICIGYRERKCVDTIGTVPVPWAGHFQCKNVNIFFKWNIRKQFYQTALGNCYGLKLPKCWLQFKKLNYCVIYYNIREHFRSLYTKYSVNVIFIEDQLRY